MREITCRGNGFLQPVTPQPFQVELAPYRGVMSGGSTCQTLVVTCYIPPWPFAHEDIGSTNQTLLVIKNKKKEHEAWKGWRKMQWILKDLKGGEETKYTKISCIKFSKLNKILYLNAMYFNTWKYYFYMYLSLYGVHGMCYLDVWRSKVKEFVLSLYHWVLSIEQRLKAWQQPPFPYEPCWPE